MALAHENLAVAVGAAKEIAKAIVQGTEGRGALVSGRTSSVYLSLAVMHKQLLAVDPPPAPVAHFIPELEHLARGCSGRLGPVKPLIEAALRAAREPEASPGPDAAP